MSKRATKIVSPTFDESVVNPAGTPCAAPAALVAQPAEPAIGPVMAFDTWATNAELIADCAQLGYLRSDWTTWDATYGEGAFWNKWRPDTLIGTDLDPAKNDNKLIGPVDFTASPWDDRSFDCVVFDPPYKLNGTPDAATDERYGVHEPTNWRDRMNLIRRGVIECARVLGDGFLLVKCQDQVRSGKVRWQSDEVTRWAAQCGLGKVDRFDFVGYRPQPDGRRQVHARRNTSQLLVFKRGWVSGWELIQDDACFACDRPATDHAGGTVGVGCPSERRAPCDCLGCGGVLDANDWCEVCDSARVRYENQVGQ